MSDRERAAIEAAAKSIWGRARLDKGKPWDDFLEDARQAIAAYNAALQNESPLAKPAEQRKDEAQTLQSPEAQTLQSPEHIPAEEER